ncbi:c-type cytochrome biogenesis protein CcmI [Rhodalgimonas zhirmunskyi]|uniref:c-type cytochrome biogenesis protein CcmI n=1 Tax=Rhodalgimonas zhirmunskyi TaxID=2964767 RepID=UPI0029529455|nr:c-type cytochrome biogenesis protein CcmI [Rhodoalgimonas zhirmunskyi]
MIFWITAAALAIAVTAIVLTALLRSKDAGEHPAAYDLRVYRDQLKEVERDLARGVISEADAERTRAEVGRRVLSADTQLKAARTGSAQPRGATIGLAVVVALVMVGGSAALYPQLGSPGKRDLPLALRIANSDAARADRPSQQEAEAKLPPMTTPTPDPKFAELMDKLRTTVAERPDDLQGQLLLARNEAAIGNFKAAYEAQQDVLRLKGDEAAAADYAVLAEMLISAANGYVSPEAEEALKASLSRDPGYKPSRYYTGLLMIQADRPDMAFRLWDRLLREGPPNAPWIPMIQREIEELAWRAGVQNYQAPAPAPAMTGLPGPTREDMENAQSMSAEDRAEMIRGMVEQLNDKLANEGGTPEEWARLIGALGVLGQTERAQAIWGEAQQIFADKPQMLAVVRGGAVKAGLLQTAPPAAELPGPSQDDVQNASEMSADERQEMIRGMVGRLSERLFDEGGSAQEWARLITSQAMLGDKDAAQKALEAGRAAYAGDTTALTTLSNAAAQAGLSE